MHLMRLFAIESHCAVMWFNKGRFRWHVDFWNISDGVLSPLLVTEYGNTGCGVFKRGVQNYKGFCIRINILKGNYWILRIGLMETSEVFKNQSFQNPLFSSYLSNSVPPFPLLKTPKPVLPYYRVTRGYNKTRPPVSLKVNSVSFIDFFRSDFVQESRFEGFFLATRVARLTLKKNFFDQISNYSIIWSNQREIRQNYQCAVLYSVPASNEI